MCLHNLVASKQEECKVNCFIITLGKPTQKQWPWVHGMWGERENEVNEIRYYRLY